MKFHVARASLFALALSACAAQPQAEAPAPKAALAPGAREVPSKVITAPGGVSPEMAKLIGSPLAPFWNTDPKTPAEWKTWVAQRAEVSIGIARDAAAKFGVKYEKITLGGVPAYMVTPANIAPANRNRLLFHVHGGGYVLSPGEAAVTEAINMAYYGGFRVVSVDYRMPPDAPYPAAMDDAMAAYKAAIKMAKPKNMAVFGTSTGGGMTLALILRAKAEHLPLPAAIAPGTPWADLTETGDTYFTNEFVDNVLVSWKGWLGRAAKLYAGNVDLKDPQLSPIYGDMHGFPPTILTTGTRDLFLSNTVRVHRKLRDSGVTADLNVYEGQSHAQYGANPFAPETKEAFTDIAKFFDKYLGK